jgi:cobalt/nickel transport system permease protein
VIIFDDVAERRFVARLDPRVRVLCVALYAVLICLAERPLVVVAGLVVAGGLLAASGVPARRVLRRLFALNAFMLLLLATMPLCMPGAPAFRLGGLAWSVQGLSRGVLIALRANGAMTMMTALLGTMEATHLGFALSRLGVPDTFAHLLLFMTRYIEIIHHEYHHLRDAMRLRAFHPRFDRHTFRAFGFLVGRLLVRSVNRSERIMEAMKCRGFRGRLYILTPCHIERADIAFGIIALAGLAVLAIWEWA